MYKLDKVPDGWYRRNELSIVHLADNIKIIRCQSDELIEYLISIDDYVTPIAKVVFLDTYLHYPSTEQTEYIYLTKDYQTIRVIESEDGITSEKETF